MISTDSSKNAGHLHFELDQAKIAPASVALEWVGAGITKSQATSSWAVGKLIFSQPNFLSPEPCNKFRQSSLSHAGHNQIVELGSPLGQV